MAARLDGTSEHFPIRLLTVRRSSAVQLAEGFEVVFPSEVVHARPPVTALADVDDSLPAPGLVILCLKGADTEPVMRRLSPRLSESTVVVTPQNGLHAFRLAESLGRHRVVGAILAYDGQCTGPRSAEQRRRAPRIRIGTLDGDVPAVDSATAVLERLAPITRVPDLVSALWGKLVLNSAGNAMSAVLDRTMGEVLEENDSLERCIRLFAEGLAVARAAGARPTSDDLGGLDPDAFGLDAVIDESVRSRFFAAHQEVLGLRSSMCRDLRSGRRTEAPWLQGEVVRAGARYGVPTPLHDTVLRDLASLESATAASPTSSADRRRFHPAR